MSLSCGGASDDASGVAAGRTNDVDEAVGDADQGLLCPISLGLLLDPVRAPAWLDDNGVEHAGTVYDRAAILESLALKLEDPLSQRPLRQSDLVPDDEMRDRARAYLDAWRLAKREGGGGA